MKRIWQIIRAFGVFITAFIYVCICTILGEFIDVNWFVTVLLLLLIVIIRICVILLSNSVTQVRNNIDRDDFDLEKNEDLFCEIEEKIQNPQELSYDLDFHLLITSSVVAAEGHIKKKAFEIYVENA